MNYWPCTTSGEDDHICACAGEVGCNVMWCNSGQLGQHWLEVMHGHMRSPSRKKLLISLFKGNSVVSGRWSRQSVIKEKGKCDSVLLPCSHTNTTHLTQQSNDPFCTDCIEFIGELVSSFCHTQHGGKSRGQSSLLSLCDTYYRFFSHRLHVSLTTLFLNLFLH